MGYGTQLSAIIAICLISGAAIIAAVALSGAALTASNNADAKAQSIIDMMYPPPVKRSVAGRNVKQQPHKGRVIADETYFQVLQGQLEKLDSDIKQNSVREHFWTDFRQGVPALGQCTPNPLVAFALYPVSVADAFTTFGPLDANVLGVNPPFTCSPTMSSHVNSKLTISTKGAASGTGSNLWRIANNWGPAPAETMTFDVIAAFENDVNASVADSVYDSALHPLGADKDVRITSPGAIMLVADVDTPACGASGCVCTVCFFATNSSVWAFHDFQMDFFGPGPNFRQINKGVKIADFDTGIPHVYRGDYDRKNRQLRWFIDGVLKHTESINGAMPSPAAGNIWLNRGNGVYPIFTPKFGAFVVGVSVNFGGAGVWPSTPGLEGDATFFPPGFQHFPTTFGATAAAASAPPSLARAGTITLDTIQTYTHEYRAL